MSNISIEDKIADCIVRRLLLEMAQTAVCAGVENADREPFLMIGGHSND